MNRVGYGKDFYMIVFGLLIIKNMIMFLKVSFYFLGIYIKIFIDEIMIFEVVLEYSYV